MQSAEIQCWMTHIPYRNGNLMAHLLPTSLPFSAITIINQSTHSFLLTIHLACVSPQWAATICQQEIPVSWNESTLLLWNAPGLSEGETDWVLMRISLHGSVSRNTKESWSPASLQCRCWALGVIGLLPTAWEPGLSSQHWALVLSSSGLCRHWRLYYG